MDDWVYSRRTVFQKVREGLNLGLMTPGDRTSVSNLGAMRRTDPIFSLMAKTRKLHLLSSSTSTAVLEQLDKFVCPMGAIWSTTVIYFQYFFSVSE